MLIVTKVIAFCDAPRDWKTSTLYVDISERGTLWGEPYYPAALSRREQLRSYSYDLCGRIETDLQFRHELTLLHGKTLVCYCKTKRQPDCPCHGDILAEAADTLYLQRENWRAFLLEQAKREPIDLRELTLENERKRREVSDLAQRASIASGFVCDHESFKRYRREYLHYLRQP